MSGSYGFQRSRKVVYLAVWQDDSAQVSGSAGEPEVIEAVFRHAYFRRKLAFFFCEMVPEFP